MKPARVVALVLGCLLLLPGVALLLGGGALGVGYAVARGDDGYFELELDRFQTPTAVIRSEDIDFLADPGSPDWLVGFFDLDVRVDARTVMAADQLFVGVGPEDDVDAWLADVAHDEVVAIDNRTPEYERQGGLITAVEPPGDLDFWVATNADDPSGALLWAPDEGRWAVVVANADGRPGVSADVTIGAKSGLFLPVALTMLGIGIALVALSVVLIVVGTLRPAGAGAPMATAPSAFAGMGESAASQEHPVALNARLDPDLSRWRWLVKWFLAIPHFIVLLFLWVAFAVTTFVAGIAILFTGRYPQSIWEFNLGVLRWTWRVNYYCGTGGIGTDRYPPFSLHREPDYPAVLDIAYPERLSRGLVLVKWWLLAIPHYVILALVAGGTYGWTSSDGDWRVAGPSLLGVLVFITGVTLLFTDRYPRSLFDLIVGFNRWMYRVIAYAALMTDRYPPFRLDQGGMEPGSPLPPPPTGDTGRATGTGRQPATDR